MGSTSLVLAMIEAEAMRDDLSVRRPVATLHEVSHDPSLEAKVELVDGRRMTALELLQEYHDRAAAFVAERSGGEPDADTAEVMHWWGTVLDRLARDPMEARREVDWVAKLAVLEGYRERDSPRLGRPTAQGRRPPVVRRAGRTAASRTASRRRAGSRCSSTRPTSSPPSRSRPPTPGPGSADSACGASRMPWSRRPGTRSSSTSRASATLQRVPMLEPLKGTEEGVGDIVRSAPDAASLLEALAAQRGPGRLARRLDACGRCEEGRGRHPERSSDDPTAREGR